MVNEESLKHYRDMKGAMDTSFEDGEKKGEEKKAKKMAKAMKEEGEPIEKIEKYTGLSREEIENL
jgi:predicted transposase YdaD